MYATVGNGNQKPQKTSSSRPIRYLMPFTSVTVPTDGLWRSLCPLSDQTLAYCLSKPRLLGTARLPIKAVVRCTRYSTRTARTSPRSSNPPIPWSAQVLALRRNDWSTGQPTSDVEPASDAGKPTKEREKRDSIRDLYRSLQDEAYRGQVRQVDRIVTSLVKDHEEPPSVNIYNALILVNIDAEQGSAARAEALFKEMHLRGLTPNSAIYHSILKVLAVHPNYLLRNHVLEEMRERWINLSQDGYHDVVAGLIRDSQLELALDRLESMEREGLGVEAWLYDMMIYALVDREEFDPALAIVKRRYESDDRAIAATMWFHLLDRGSMALHHQITSYVWRHQVERVHVVPSDGVCNNVLVTAARHGDSDLAADVVRILTARGTRLQLHHYEALSEGYLASSDIKAAFSVFSIAHAAKTAPEESSLASIYEWMSRHESRVKLAYDAIGELRNQGRRIPTVFLNCVMRACVPGNAGLVVGIYKRLREFCPAGPTTETFNLLLRACLSLPSKDTGDFYRKEMARVGVSPDRQTYITSILLEVRQKNLGRAIDLLREMDAGGFQPTREVFVALIGLCTDEWNMSQVSTLLSRMKTAGFSTVGLQRR